MFKNLKETGLTEAIQFSIVFLLIYYLKANGFPSLLLFFVTSVFNLILLNFFNEKKAFRKSISSALFVLFISLPFASRGSSLNNAIFIFSLTISLFLIIRNQRENLFISLLPVFAVWSFVGNWEFPSTFSPFVIYGVKELSFVSSALMLMSLSVENSKALILLFLAATLLVAPFLRGYLLSELALFRNLFTETFNLNMVITTIAQALLFSTLILSILRKRENADRLIIRSLILIAPLLTLFAVARHFINPDLPLPFTPVKIIAAFCFTASLYGLTFFKPYQEFKPILFLLLPFLVARMIAPSEANYFYYHKENYFSYSIGAEHLGPWYLLWFAFVSIFINFRQWLAFALFLVSLFFLREIYFTRLFHFISTAPIEFFKDLGAEGVSWVRKPVIASEPYIAFIAGLIILSVLLTKLFLKRSNDERTSIAS
ncbi:MAG: hypothetical protein N2440_06190 [Actinobacteria bacterium]|nr:hypothetical protein [Actinomycetota bacterium]